MKQYMDLGPTPCDEDCAQVGSENYTERAKKECAVYVRQMHRVLAANGHPESTWPEGFNIVVRGEPHDFGTYHEVKVRYDDSDEKAVELAFIAESLVPAKWDDEALKELGPLVWGV